MEENLQEVEETKKKSTPKTKKKGIPSFEELRKVDLSPYIKKRDKADYVNCAVIKQLLHDNGAETVYFIPLTNENGSSLFMSDMEFVDSKGNKNRCYETRIKIVIDDLEFEMQSPVMNGANPVKDNSMSQQRVWNSMCRSFVKGVAIRTGLGFDLWSRLEQNEEEEAETEDLSKHNIMKVAERVKQKLTEKMASGLTLEDIAEKINLTTDELKAYLSYYATLNRLEKEIEKIDTK